MLHSENFVLWFTDIVHIQVIKTECMLYIRVLPTDVKSSAENGSPTKSCTLVLSIQKIIEFLT